MPMPDYVFAEELSLIEFQQLENPLPSCDIDVVRDDQTDIIKRQLSQLESPLDDARDGQEIDEIEFDVIRFGTTNPLKERAFGMRQKRHQAVRLAVLVEDNRACAFAL